MGVRGQGIAMAVLALTALTSPAPAVAARASVTVGLTTRTPAASTGSSLSIDWRNPANPAGKPYSVKSFVTEFPAGTTIDTGAIEQCKASDAELTARGAAACPAGSRVSTGTVLTDNGSTAGFPRFVKNEVTNFNNDGELIGIAESKDPPTRVVTRGKIHGNTLTTEVPTLPGNPPPDPYNAFRDLRLSGPALGAAGRPYARTPPTCPRSGTWVARFTFNYQDGMTEHSTVGVPCARDRRAPRVRFRGPRRRRCTRSDFTLRVRVGERTPLRRAAAYLDGRLVHATRRKVFRSHIAALRLQAGRHRLTVIARDAAGNRGRRTLAFRRCR
jgi:hypothetical protein